VTVEEPLVFENLPPARYAIRATDSDGSCGGIQALDLTDGGPAEPVSILLQPPGSIHGRTSPSERSSSVSVVLTDLEAGRESAVRVWIGNAEGAFDFRSLPPGRYCLGIYELDSPERWSREDLGCDRTVIEVIAGQSTILEPEE
jgi:hypothetical protein